MIVDVSTATALLQKGDVVALPTETVYGLAGSINNPSAIEKIFKTKERPFFDPLIVHVGRPQQLLPLVESFGSAAQKLAKSFWPGPLTLVLKKSPLVSDMITAGHDTVALRMPYHSTTLQIISDVGPVAAPSANKFGRVSPTTSSHVESEFASQVAVVDGGPCSVGVESTILRVNESEAKVELTLLRPGTITSTQIEDALVSLQKNKIWIEATQHVAPGQLPNHYQPTTPLVTSTPDIAWDEKLHIEIMNQLQLTTSKQQPVLWTIKENDARLAARTMYAQMRTFSEKTPPAPYIFLQLPSDIGSENWSAVKDRLDKAASLKIEQKDKCFHWIRK